MVWKRNLLVGCLPVSLAPLRVEAQQVIGKDSLPTHSLQRIIIEAPRAPLEEIPRVKSVSLSHRDLNLELLLKNIELTSPFPFSTMAYKDIVYGTSTFYRFNSGASFPILIRDNFNYTLTSGFSSFHTHLERGEADAITPSLDEAIMIETEVENGIQLHAQPLRGGISVGHEGKNINFGLSLEYLRPKILPERWEEDLGILGRGFRPQGYFEVKSGKNSFAFYVHQIGIDTDLTNSFADSLNIENYVEEHRQVLLGTSGTISLGDASLDITASKQEGRTNTLIRELGESKDLSQKLSFESGEFAISQENSRIGFGLFHLERINTLDSLKEFSGMRFSIDQTQPLYGLGIRLRANAKIDLIEDIFYPSFYGELEKELSHFSFGLRGGYLLDVVTRENMEETTAEFYPTSEIFPQEVVYGLLQAETRFGNSRIRVSAEPKKANTKFYENGEIRGTSYNLSYLFLSRGFSGELSGTLRNLDLIRDGESYPPPGAPDSELKARVIIQNENYGLMTSFALKENFPFPYRRDRTADLGEQKELGLSFFLDKGPLHLGITGTNFLKLFGIKNYIAAYEGIERDENDEAIIKYLEMPFIPYASLEFSWEF
jgi:hypothetical protein